MNRLFLTDNPLPMRKYILVMACIGLIPSLLISALLNASGVFSQVGPDVASWKQQGVVFVVIGVLILSPVLETLVMAFFILLLSLLIKSKIRVAAASAILWAVLHSLISPTWGLIICWPFFVFSCAYLTWRPQSILKGLWVAAAIHFLQNLLPTIGLIVMMI